MVLLIDNYDSFTYNLYDYILQSEQECKVIRNDELSIEEIKQLEFDNIVISPGPCSPKESGVCMDVLNEFYSEKPILGVCLGHQAIGEYFDALLTKANKPMHGKTSEIIITNHPIFNDLSNTITVMRYHSLILKDVKPPLEIIAKTKEDEVMAIAHNSLPIVGLQFHPESILSPTGLKILDNWFKWIDKQK